MAPWTLRGPSSNSQNVPNANTRDTHEPSTPGGSQRPTRHTDEDILSHGYDVPSLQSQRNGNTPSNSISGTPSRHGRSISHPFPSLFQGKNKRHGDRAVAIDSTEEDHHSQMKSPNTRPSRIADKDLMTGRCMTCDSMVRWPKGLGVFRCTVCMTINDLNPRASDTAPSNEKSTRPLINHESDGRGATHTRGLLPGLIYQG